jgi:hypothetical protein
LFDTFLWLHKLKENKNYIPLHRSHLLVKRRGIDRIMEAANQVCLDMVRRVPAISGRTSIQKQGFGVETYFYKLNLNALRAIQLATLRDSCDFINFALARAKSAPDISS